MIHTVVGAVNIRHKWEGHFQTVSVLHRAVRGPVWRPCKASLMSSDVEVPSTQLYFSEAIRPDAGRVGWVFLSWVCLKCSLSSSWVVLVLDLRGSPLSISVCSTGWLSVRVPWPGLCVSTTLFTSRRPRQVRIKGRHTLVHLHRNTPMRDGCHALIHLHRNTVMRARSWQQETARKNKIHSDFFCLTGFICFSWTNVRKSNEE